MTSVLGPVDIRGRSTEELLASGGDSRHIPDSVGRNRYGNTYAPQRGLLTFGSCTSSTVSADAFAAAERLHGWLRALEPQLLDRTIDDLYERVRTEIVANISMFHAENIDVVITPSGTDAELIALLASLGERPLTSIVVGASEAGSGTALAAAGLHFDEFAPSGRSVEIGEPVDEEVAQRVQTVLVGVRSADGSPRDVQDLDDEVRVTVHDAIGAGRDVLVHVIAHSKTGVHAPSLATVHELVAAHPERVKVAIDAAQGRFSRRGLRESLDRGYMTMTTGSKFFGGPPFAGAVLIPHVAGRCELGIEAFPAAFSDYFAASMLPQEWAAARRTLSGVDNVGLLLRWWAALAEIRDYYSVPAQLRLEVLSHAQAAFPAKIAASSRLVLDAIPPPLAENEHQRLLESKTTVFPFTCRGRDGALLGAGDLRQIQLAMRDPLVPVSSTGADISRFADLRAEIGQPVELGGSSSPCVLRLAIGAREIIRTCVVSAKGATFGERLDALTDDISAAVQKLDHLAGEVPASAGGGR